MGLMERAAQQGGSAEKIILRRELDPALRPSLELIEQLAMLRRAEAKAIRLQAKFYAKAARLNNDIARYLNSKATMYEMGYDAPTAESKAHEAMARLNEHMAKGYADEAD
jgi:hypothetical protein